MSTSIDPRQRPNLWSYISFGSVPRRRSISSSLPLRNPEGGYIKSYGRASNGAHHQTGIVDQLKGAWMAQSPRSRLLKTGGLVAFIVCLFLIFSPNERAKVEGLVPGRKGASSVPASGTTSGSSKCSKPYSSDKPLIQYVLMIDAGSTGSRIHVYKFNNCGPAPDLEHEFFRMTEKIEGRSSGLSSYESDAEGAAKSLDPLMDYALESVPKEYRSCSPVAVKATAGLRLLGQEKSDKILQAVRTRLETAYPFPVVSKENDGVVVIDGKDEGVYAWITTNYLLGKIGGPDNSPTAAIFDLGGGSTQIVFQPTFKSPSKGMPEKLAEGDHKYKLSFGGRNFDLYQHSHLGYGLMSARKAMHKVVVQAKKDAHPGEDTWTSKPIENPCLAVNTTSKEPVKVELDDGSKYTVTFTGPTVGGAAQCRGIAEKILVKDAECKLAPCSFNGVHQPSLEKTFAREDVYIFSYFYDRTKPLGMPESFTLRELRGLTAQVCDGKGSWGSFEAIEGAVAELDDRPEHCLDLNFMMALLHTGYEMPIDRELRIAKKIKDNELGWCLGASLPLLSQGSGWECKIKEVS